MGGGDLMQLIALALVTEGLRLQQRVHKWPHNFLPPFLIYCVLNCDLGYAVVIWAGVDITICHSNSLSDHICTRALYLQVVM